MNVVFTVVTNQYDDLKPILVKNNDWRYVAIVDDTSIDNKGWRLLPIERLNPPEGLNNIYLQRWVKIIGAMNYFKCDTIYVDANIEIKKDITELYREGLMQFKKHPVRSCYIEEGKRCKELNKANIELIDKQIKSYIEQGYEGDTGMIESNVLFRPCNGKVVDFCKLWFNELLQFTHRDQLSVMKVLEDTLIDYDVLSYNLVEGYIKKHIHK